MTPRIKDEFAEDEVPDLDRLEGPLAFAEKKNDVLEGGDWVQTDAVESEE